MKKLLPIFAFAAFALFLTTTNALAASTPQDFKI